MSEREQQGEEGILVGRGGSASSEVVILVDAFGSVG